MDYGIERRKPFNKKILYIVIAVVAVVLLLAVVGILAFIFIISPMIPIKYHYSSYYEDGILVVEQYELSRQYEVFYEYMRDGVTQKYIYIYSDDYTTNIAVSSEIEEVYNSYSLTYTCESKVEDLIKSEYESETHDTFEIFADNVLDMIVSDCTRDAHSVTTITESVHVDYGLDENWSVDYFLEEGDDIIHESYISIGNSFSNVDNNIAKVLYQGSGILEQNHIYGYYTCSSSITNIVQSIYTANNYDISMKDDYQLLINDLITHLNTNCTYSDSIDIGGVILY